MSGRLPGTRARRHLAWAGLISLFAILAGYKGILPVFRSHLAAYLGIGDARFGLLLSAGSLTGLAGNLAAGALLDRWGPRRVIRMCLAGIGCGMLIVGFSGPGFWRFVAAAAVSGFFGPPLFISVNAYLARLFPRHRRRVIALNFATGSFGGMLFPLAAEGLLKLAAGPATFAQVLHGPFILVGLTLLGASFIYRARPVARRPAPRPGADAPGRFALPPALLCLALLMALHGTADYVLYAWMPRFLEGLGPQPRLFPPGAALSGYSLAYLVSRLVLAALPDRAGRRLFLVLPGVAGGALMAAAVLSRSYLVASVGYVLAAFCWSFEYPVMVGLALEAGKKRFGATMAAAGLVGGVLSFGALNLVGRFVEVAGAARMWQPMLAPAGVFVLIGLAGAGWLARFGRAGAARRD